MLAFKDQLDALLTEELTCTEDPRIVGPNPELFDTYPRYSPMREFPQPDWAR